jgi:hypothetical protein
MESKKELEQLGNSVDFAISQTQNQLNNIGSDLKISIPIAALFAAIGAGSFFKLLMLWIPTAFAFWVLYLFWGPVSQAGKYRSTNRQATLQQYQQLSKRRQQLGKETVTKILTPLSYSLTVIYIISVIILLIAKSGLIPADNYSIWQPLIVSLLLIAILLGGLTIYRHVDISDINAFVQLTSDKDKLKKQVKKHWLRWVIVILGFGALMACYFVLPLWALITSWSLYYTGAMLYKILIVLVLQVLAFFLVCGFLTNQYAKTDLSNNISALSGIRFQINQLLSLPIIPEKEISLLKARYYMSIKYRFQRERLLGFILVYAPILNDAYVNSESEQTKNENIDKPHVNT